MSRTFKAAALAAGLLITLSASAQLAKWSDGGGTSFQEANVDVAVDSDGNVITTGYQVIGSGANWVTKKYSPTGQLLFETSYSTQHGSSDDRPAAVCIGPNNNIFVAGYGQLPHNNFGTVPTSTVVRYSPTGQQIMVDLATEFPNSYALHMEPNPNGDGVIVAGKHGTPGSTLFAYSVTASGYRQLLRNVKYGWEDMPTGLEVDAQGGIYIGGYTRSLNNVHSSFVTKITTEGTPVWSLDVLAGKNSQVRDIAYDPADNSVYATGSVDLESGNRDVFYQKINAQTVEVRGPYFYNGAANGLDEGLKIDAANGRAAIAARVSEDYGKATDVGVLYCNSYGINAIAWYGLPSGVEESISDLQIDGLGNAYVAGNEPTRSRLDGFLLKTSADGKIVWKMANNTRSVYDDIYSALAMDAAGSIYVVGRAEWEFGQSDFFAKSVQQAEWMMPNQVFGGATLTGKLVLNSPGTFYLNGRCNPEGYIGRPFVIIAAGPETAAPTLNMPTAAVATDTDVLLTASGPEGETSIMVRVLAPRPLSLTIWPNAVRGGESAEATLVMTGISPEQGTPVLIRDDSAFVDTPAWITVGAEDGAETFPVGTKPVNAPATRKVFVTANGVTKSAAITLNPAQLTGLNLSASQVIGGNAVTGTVTLGAAAGLGGQAVALSDNSTALTTPASVVVGAGTSSATFAVQTAVVSVPATRQVTASLSGVTLTKSLTLFPPAAKLENISLEATSIQRGSWTTGTIKLAQPWISPVNVQISDSSDYINTPAEVTIPAGATIATFQVTVDGTWWGYTRLITARLNGVAKSFSLTVTE